MVVLHKNKKIGMHSSLPRPQISHAHPPQKNPIVTLGGIVYQTVLKREMKCLGMALSSGGTVTSVQHRSL